ncbi:hypothetical protein HPB52_009057 [Rhipicephalus sanguineus]|uniref:Reverse transcriptase zinc-binding domain-containing protein n=1 Tax=Rhipicephalus sanguineus TaxID=34632 RepID=A0A9D4SYJ8_RHISA|nr:hypothetical protein HPB52_009057 [Rhipicephalus sanguineus]
MFLEAERHPAPLAESRSTFYKGAANTWRMLETEAPECDIDKDPPVRIVESVTRRQMSDEDNRKAEAWKKSKAKQSRGLPKEVQDFELHRFGVVPSARCPICRAGESTAHVRFECPAAKPVWRLTAKHFNIRPPPTLNRNRGAFARLVIACTLFVIWKRRCLAEARRKPVRVAYPAISCIRGMVWKHLADELEARAEEKFLRRWHTRFLVLKDGKLSFPITPY